MILRSSFRPYSRYTTDSGHNKEVKCVLTRGVDGPASDLWTYSHGSLRGAEERPTRPLPTDATGIFLDLGTHRG
jgi:hypothetical protein